MNRVSKLKLVAYLRIVFFRENTRFVLNLLCNTIIFTRNSRNSEFWVLNREKTTQNSKVDYWVVVELSTQRQLTIEFKKRVNKPTDEIQFLKIQNPKKIGKILSNAKIKEFFHLWFTWYSCLVTYNSFEKMPDFHGLFQASLFEVPSPWFGFTMKTPNLSVKISAHLTSQERKMDLQFALFVIVRVSTLLESLKYHANCPSAPPKLVHFLTSGILKYFIRCFKKNRKL